MKKLFGLMIIIAAACTAAACFSPVGTIDTRRGSSDGDDALWAVPNRIIYDLNPIEGVFDRNTDLQVFLSDKGDVFIVPVSKTELYIVEDPGYASERKIFLNGNGRYVFQKAGRKQVEIHYNEMICYYSVEVRAVPFGEGDDGEGFFEIIWY